MIRAAAEPLGELGGRHLLIDRLTGRPIGVVQGLAALAQTSQMVARVEGEHGIAWCTTAEVDARGQDAGRRIVRLVERVLGRSSDAARLALSDRGLVSDRIRLRDGRPALELGDVPVADETLDLPEFVDAWGLELWQRAGGTGRPWRLVAGGAWRRLSSRVVHGDLPDRAPGRQWVRHVEPGAGALAIGPMTLAACRPRTDGKVTTQVWVPAGAERPAPVASAEALDGLWRLLHDTLRTPGVAFDTGLVPHPRMAFRRANSLTSRPRALAG